MTDEPEHYMLLFLWLGGNLLLKVFCIISLELMKLLLYNKYYDRWLTIWVTFPKVEDVLPCLSLELKVRIWSVNCFNVESTYSLHADTRFLFIFCHYKWKLLNESHHYPVVFTLVRRIHSHCNFSNFIIIFVNIQLHFFHPFDVI